MVQLATRFESTGSTKLRNFSKKFERPSPLKAEEPAPTPAPRDDIFERMDIATKLEQDNSLLETIDVFPDIRMTLLFIIFNVMKLYPSLKTERPLLTPASLVSYCLFLIYAFALVNDLHGRPESSFAASEFMNDDNRAQLFDALCRAYVPPFLLTIFHALSDCNDPRRPGLTYFCTLAGTIFCKDFGRYIPAQIFLHMHNISTEEDTSRNVASAYMHLLNTELFTDNSTTGRNVRISNYIAAAHTNAANTVYESWLYEAIRTLFSPVTGKSLLRRTNIQFVPIQTPNIVLFPDQPSDVILANPYYMYLNADPKNVRHTLKFVNTMSSLVKSDLNGSFQLGAIPDDLSGVNILVHGYCRYQLPTWQDSTVDTDLKDKFKTIPDETFASDIAFKTPTKYAKKHTFPQLTDGSSKTLPLNTIGNFISKLMLWNPDYPHKESDEPSAIKEMSFDPVKDVSGRTVFLDPYTSGDGPISYSTLAGLVIESDELDGSSVPMPNSDIGLSKINRDFLQGAVPAHNVRSAFGATAHHPVSPISRTILKRDYQKIAHDLYAIEESRLGIMDADINMATAPTAPAGFKLIQHIRSQYQMFNKWSFTSDSDTNNAPVTLNVWSPYRYVSNQDGQYPIEKDVYFLCNFRTLYGTHIPLLGMRHPSVVIPIS